MKKTVILVCVLWLATVIFPAMLLRDKTDEPVLETNLPDGTVDEIPDNYIVETMAEVSRDAAVTVEVMENGEIVALQLDEYLAGVLAAGDAGLISGGSFEGAGCRRA